MDPTQGTATEQSNPTEWQELRGHARHQAIDVIRLILILLQDAVILVVGFGAEFVYDHWLRSEHPFFQLAINLSSAFFLLLYVITVSVHIVQYIRGQVGGTKSNLLGQYLPWAIIGGGVVASGVALSLPTFHRETPPETHRPVERFAISLPKNSQLVGATSDSVVLSANGTHLVYVASTENGPTKLYVRPLNSLESHPITGTEGGRTPFLSPDGKWIGFFADGKLKKVEITGGPVLTICNAQGTSAEWGPNDTIIFQPQIASPLWEISASGGEPRRVTAFQRNEVNHIRPRFLPDGKTFLFTATTGSGTESTLVAVQRIGSLEHQILVRGGSSGTYVPTGHLIYYRAGSLMGALFDLETLQVKGAPAPVLEGVLSSSTVQIPQGQYSFSQKGHLVYIPGNFLSANLQLVWVDRHGKEESLPAPVRPYRAPRVSPDGRKIAVGIGNDLWIYDVFRNTLTRLTFEGNNATYAGVWSPDSKRVVFPSDRAGVLNLFWKAADGSGAEERLTTSPSVQRVSSFSPDGRFLMYAEVDPKSAQDIWVLPMDGDRKPHPFLQTPFNESSGQISPDGRWVAYVSDESGQQEVYIRPFPGPGGEWQVSAGGGSEITWSTKGDELFYRTGNQKQFMMAVEIQTRPIFSVSKPHVLFEGDYIANTASSSGALYSIAPDGRFLMAKAGMQVETLNQINVVENWFEELKQKVPVQ